MNNLAHLIAVTNQTACLQITLPCWVSLAYKLWCSETVPKNTIVLLSVRNEQMRFVRPEKWSAMPCSVSEIDVYQRALCRSSTSSVSNSPGVCKSRTRHPQWHPMIRSVNYRPHPSPSATSYPSKRLHMPDARTHVDVPTFAPRIQQSPNSEIFYDCEAGDVKRYDDVCVSVKTLIIKASPCSTAPFSS